MAANDQRVARFFFCVEWNMCALARKRHRILFKSGLPDVLGGLSGHALAQNDFR
jgi:hypothetical protein